MTWVEEWKLMLEQQSYAEPEYDLRIYVEIQHLCQRLRVVYQPSIYTEYMKWEDNYGHLYRIMDGSFSPVPTQAHLNHFANHSETILFQNEERKRIAQLEEFAHKNNIIFHDDSIIEKIALAAHYFRMHG